MDKLKCAEVGDFIEPDEWPIGSNLEEDDGFKDSSFAGCKFRLSTNRCLGTDDKPYKVAVNVKITGKPHWIRHDRYRSRCKIEFVGDGEPSTFSGAWLYTNERYE